MSTHGYAIAGIAVILVIAMFVVFSEDIQDVQYEYTGIASDVKEGSSGYTFQLNTKDGTMKCFTRDPVLDEGYYGITGSFSSDGSIFFIEELALLDRFCEHSISSSSLTMGGSDVRRSG